MQEPVQEPVQITLPERFPLVKNNTNGSLYHIYTVTNGYKGINPHYIALMSEAIQKRKHTWFGSLEAPKESDLVKQIIGKNGFHLKQFTNKYGLDLIWHDRTAHNFLLWGPRANLISALYAVKRQIKRFSEKYTRDMLMMQHLDMGLQNLDVSLQNTDMSQPCLLREREKDDTDLEPERKKIKCD
jgi:hypothetical protein